MDFNEFTQQLCQRIRQQMPQNCLVKMQKVQKNNGVIRTGMIMEREDEHDEHILPTIYLEDYYAKYLNGSNLESLAETIVSVLLQDVAGIREKMIPLKSESFEEIRSRIIFRLVNRKKNQKILKESPSVPFLDLSIVFFYLVEHTDTGLSSVRITNALAERWGVKESELLSAALSNMPQHFPFIVEKIEQVVKRFLPEHMQVEGEIELLDNIPMYVLTNQSGMNGATVLLYKDVLSQLSCQLNSNLYLLPSSVHEIIAIPYETSQQQSRLEQMVQEINCQIDPQEVLSDHVYVFLRDSEDVVYQKLHE